jgi:hypothetical protein
MPLNAPRRCATMCAGSRSRCRTPTNADHSQVRAWMFQPLRRVQTINRRWGA